MRVDLLAGLALLAVGMCEGGTGAGAERHAGQKAGSIARAAPPAAAEPDWRRLLDPPKGSQTELPKDWKVAPESKDQPRLGPLGNTARDGHRDWWAPPPVEHLVRESVIIAVGICVGNDGSFRNPLDSPRPSALQYTTYYLRVEGYLKDATGQRAPFLKVLSDGGFLNGGQRAVWSGSSVPYLENGRRYLLYLKPNYGLPLGLRGNTSNPIGQGDEYWTVEGFRGLWWEDDGRLTGIHSEPELWPGLGKGLPFGKGLQRVYQAVLREQAALREELRQQQRRR